jgi:hypothetical protein
MNHNNCFYYISCKFCTNKIYISPSDRKYDDNINFLLCTHCIKKQDICSKSRSSSIFLLKSEDFLNLKYIYFKNVCNTQKFYLLSDVKKLAIEKYGSIDKLNIIKKNNKISNHILSTNKKMSSELLKNKRKRELQQILKNNKLEYKLYGNCYSYINYGKPSIDIIIQEELNELNKTNVNRFNLASALNNNNIVYDENNIHVKQYIHGNVSLNNTFLKLLPTINDNFLEIN